MEQPQPEQAISDWFKNVPEQTPQQFESKKEAKIKNRNSQAPH